MTYSEQIAHAAKVIKQGGIVAYPTESCFGLGCDPRNIKAIQRIIKLKKRSQKKGLILVADRIERLTGFLMPLSDEQIQRLDKSWPGPFTWICPALPSTSKWLTGAYNSLAVRVTNHPIARKLCRQTEMALVSTSANSASQDALKDAKKVAATFDDCIDFILDAPIGTDDRPSTIIDLLTGEVLR